MPGRIIGVSKDAQGNPALRMALQTREQFIRREKATSNICTAQALLANMAAAYAIYHGPEGIAQIAQRVATMAKLIEAGALTGGYTRANAGAPIFDTLALRPPKGKSALSIQIACEAKGMNIRVIDDLIAVSVDETTTLEDCKALVAALGGSLSPKSAPTALQPLRQSKFLTHPIFSTHKSETNMMRYLASLESKDLTLKQGSFLCCLRLFFHLIPLVTNPSVFCSNDSSWLVHHEAQCCCRATSCVLARV